MKSGEKRYRGDKVSRDKRGGKKIVHEQENRKLFMYIQCERENQFAHKVIAQ